MKKVFTKLLFAAMIMAGTIAFVACDKEEENTVENASIEGRWEAPRTADTPDDIAFVAIFAGENLDLYVISWGQHMRGTYTLTNGTVDFNITEAYLASSVPVSYDDDGILTSHAWEIGNLNATTLELSEGYDWYYMRGVEWDIAQRNFSQFEFKINGNTATSSMVGIPDLVFHKVQ
ncbi:MAG: hypothetical protein J6X62_00655 [Bacteroidales bacterium]|nr:hypothetical protein [Bacteroidales bacterium]